MMKLSYVVIFMTWSLAYMICCEGFALTKRSHSAVARRTVCFRYLVKKIEDDTEPVLEGEEEKNKSSDLENLEAKAEPKRNTVRAVVQRGLFGISMVWAYFTIAFGIFMTFGMLLNLFGYAYQLTENGLVIDTIQHVREENMFRAAVIQSIQETRP